jgi:cation-transporting ATPase 13A3/4/5
VSVICLQCRGAIISTDLKAKELTECALLGLNRDQIVDNLVLYGENTLVLPVPSVASLLFNEIFHPFYVFQMYSVVLWILEEYWYFAGAIAVIAVVSIVQTLMETRRRMRELAELARFDCPVQVLRDWVVRTISSSKLVPGDVVLVGTGLLPCDLALIDGGAVVNESMLAGQSPRSGQPRAPCAPRCSCHPKAFAHLTHILPCFAFCLVWPFICIISDAQVSPSLS